METMTPTVQSIVYRRDGVGPQLAWLSDTSIRAYRKKDGFLSLRLKGFLMIPSSERTACLTWIKDWSCTLKTTSGKQFPFDELSWGAVSDCFMETAYCRVRAHGSAPTELLSEKLVKLGVTYHLHIAGSPETPPAHFEVMAPLLSRACSDHSAERQFAGRSRPPSVHWAQRMPSKSQSQVTET